MRVRTLAEVSTLGSVTGRELLIVAVISLIAIGGSQVPRLVRSLTEARHRTSPPPGPGDESGAPNVPS